MKTLWSEKTLRGCCTNKVKKPLSQTIKENIASYGTATLKKEGLSGILAALLGNIPDGTLTVLLNEGIRGLANVNQTELEQMPGIGRDKALRLLAAIELSKMLVTASPVQMPVVKGPEDIVNLVMEEMRYLDREQFRAFLLNTKNQLICQETISIGTLNSSQVHPREVFKSAIKVSAAAIIIVHNHPSGDPTPSKEDLDVTQRVIKAGSILGIEVLDHVIIGDGKFLSFKTKGLMQE
jgi:DNA repair protein RadC